MEEKDSIYAVKFAIMQEQIDKLLQENEELRKGQKSLMQSRKKWKDRYYKLKKKKE